MDAVNNVNVEPDYNSAKVTYDALEGATMSVSATNLLLKLNGPRFVESL